MQDYVVCPGCRNKLPDRNLDLNNKYNASGECFEKFNDIAVYNFFKNDKNYIHQVAVDAYVAQHSGTPTTNKATVLALIGLYLYVVREYKGNKIQIEQMRIAKLQNDWPRFEVHTNINEITVLDVLNESAVGDKREEMIKKWAKYVWDCWSHEETGIANIIDI
jgi:hypothetical protein